MITNGPFGVLWASLGLGAFFIALIWLNTLLSIFLTPMFTLLATKIIGGRVVKDRDTEPPAKPAT
ncbi:MAG TPA: hypothetical protein VFW98_16305 [Gemmatimonadaceae bacterium]|nr:hypothetical protein [Gemmatimonadaceae bacterium]